MHVVAADTIIADIATELELSPTEAVLCLDDLLEDSEDFETGDLDD